ncbi:hypothetical protein FRC00_013063, partial [Tulasnella sp. 408]
MAPENKDDSLLEGEEHRLPPMAPENKDDPLQEDEEHQLPPMAPENKDDWLQEDENDWFQQEEEDDWFQQEEEDDWLRAEGDDDDIPPRSVPISQLPLPPPSPPPLHSITFGKHSSLSQAPSQQPHVEDLGASAASAESTLIRATIGDHPQDNIPTENERENFETTLRLARELKIWARVKHSNILPLIGYYLSENYEIARFISPFMVNGN